jgi:hypothetical protein
MEVHRMSFEDAIMSVLPPPTSWKKLHALAEELRKVEIDQPKPEQIEPYTLHPMLSTLLASGRVRQQPAMRSASDSSHSGYEYQRSC